MNKLYIVGNGFDLAHGLKTSYKKFYEYLTSQKLSKLLDNYLKEMDNHDKATKQLCKLKDDEIIPFWHEWEYSFATVKNC